MRRQICRRPPWLTGKFAFGQRTWRREYGVSETQPIVQLKRNRPPKGHHTALRRRLLPEAGARLVYLVLAIGEVAQHAEAKGNPKGKKKSRAHEPFGSCALF